MSKIRDYQILPYSSDSYKKSISDLDNTVSTIINTWCSFLKTTCMRYLIIPYTLMYKYFDLTLPCWGGSDIFFLYLGTFMMSSRKELPYWHGAVMSAFWKNNLYIVYYVTNSFLNSTCIVSWLKMTHTIISFVWLLIYISHGCYFLF